MNWTERFDKALNQMRDSGKLYAELKGASHKVKKWEAHFLAKLTKQFIDQGMTVGKAEIYAKASEEYAELIKGDAVIIAEEMQRTVDYDVATAEFERTRSECSLAKKENTYTD